MLVVDGGCLNFNLQVQSFQLSVTGVNLASGVDMFLFCTLLDKPFTHRSRSQLSPCHTPCQSKKITGMQHPYSVIARTGTVHGAVMFLASKLPVSPV